MSCNGDGRTSLHIAAVRGNFNIVKVIADKARVDVKDSFGFSPFSLSCLRGKLPVILLLDMLIVYH